MKVFKVIQQIETEKNSIILTYAFKILLRILAPITPHLTYLLWQELNYGDNIFSAKWPLTNQQILEKQQSIHYVVQINGKTKGNIEANVEDTKETLLDKIKHDDKLSKWLTSTPKRTIVVPKKLINVVL